MDIPLGPYTVGIDNVSDDTAVPQGGVRDAVNVNFDRSGGAAVRPRYERVAALADAHSLWTSPVLGSSYAVVGGSLCRVRYSSGWSATAIHTMQANLPVSYDDLNGSVICGNAYELLEIDAEDNVRPLGVERPGAPGVAASASGGLSAGRYAVAVSFLRSDEEGPVSAASFVDLGAGGGISVTVPQPLDAGVSMVRLYRSEANGEDLRRAFDIPVGMTSYAVGLSELGRLADTQYLDRLRGGQFVRAWRGRVLVARGRILQFSQPLRYGLSDPRHDFVQFPHRIDLMEPVEGGVFVGDRTGVRFLSGSSPKEWSIRRTGGLPPVYGSGSPVDGAKLVDDAGVAGQRAAIWLASNGFVVGAPDGSIVAAQAKRIRLPASQAAGVGAVVINDREVISSIN